MTSEAVVVLDAGTSAARCVVFDAGGEVVGQAAMPWRYLVEPDTPTMARAFDHETLWHSICELIRRTLHEAEVAADQIVAVAATTGADRRVSGLDTYPNTTPPLCESRRRRQRNVAARYLAAGPQQEAVRTT